MCIILIFIILTISLIHFYFSRQFIIENVFPETVFIIFFFKVRFAQKPFGPHNIQVRIPNMITTQNIRYYNLYIIINVLILSSCIWILEILAVVIWAVSDAYISNNSRKSPPLPPRGDSMRNGGRGLGDELICSFEANSHIVRLAWL